MSRSLAGYAATSIRCQIPADSRYADMFEIQAQADEGNAAQYAWLVGAARDQATVPLAGQVLDAVHASAG